MQEIVLRPHHGLCIRYFEGKGYNDEFTQHMGKVIESLKADSLIRLTDQSDVICQKCPNLLQGGCKSREKVRRYDEAVLNRIGLKPGIQISYGEFQEHIEEHIMKPQKMKEICGDCGWAKICHGC
ncbi:MAG: DUF1284 domain-containing protein [Thermoflexaceae bacterium]|nr:DUF1284 domain-containing protein [Thermoflexaceae bacterium]